MLGPSCIGTDRGPIDRGAIARRATWIEANSLRLWLPLGRNMANVFNRMAALVENSFVEA